MRIPVGVIVFLITAQGCGPMAFPMVRRLTPDEQKQADAAWNAMLTPVKRTDRQTLLDCMILMQMYQLGVDRFTAHSTKKTSAGQVEMTIDFDRAKPDRDQFSFRVVGPWGQTLRREQWTSAEVFQAVSDLTETPQVVREVTPTAKIELENHRAKTELRVQRAMAATQPAAN